MMTLLPAKSLGRRTFERVGEPDHHFDEGNVRPLQFWQELKAKSRSAKTSHLCKAACSRRVCKRIPYHIASLLPFAFYWTMVPQQKGANTQQLPLGQVEAGCEWSRDADV